MRNIFTFKVKTSSGDKNDDTDKSAEDETELELRKAFDLHRMVLEDDCLHRLNNNEQPPLTADQVIEEIEEIMTMNVR